MVKAASVYVQEQHQLSTTHTSGGNSFTTGRIQAEHNNQVNNSYNVQYTFLFPADEKICPDSFQSKQFASQNNLTYWKPKRGGEGEGEGCEHSTAFDTRENDHCLFGNLRESCYSAARRISPFPLQTTTKDRNTNSQKIKIKMFQQEESIKMSVKKDGLLFQQKLLCTVYGDISVSVCRMPNTRKNKHKKRNEHALK